MPSPPVAGRSGALARVRRRALAERIPIAGTFELTARCNLRCVHCYQGSRGRANDAVRELTADEIRALVDAAVEAGCLDMLLTGGEPLLRKDFAAIYRHVRERGVLVTVFTNGTLVSDEHVALFRELPPMVVEVSLYGATRETYESVTGVAGSYDRCLAGVRRLLAGGVSTALKTIILRTNQHEVGAMADLARALGVKFRMDPVVCPQLDGDPAPLAERVDPDTAARLQFADPADRARTRAYLASVRKSGAVDTVYKCDAGVVAFYVTAGGRLRPCMMATDMEFDAAGKGFGPAWKAATGMVGDAAWAVEDGCRNCENLPICGYCPPLLRLEKGHGEFPTRYLCETGRARRIVVEENVSRSEMKEGTSAH